MLLYEKLQIFQTLICVIITVMCIAAVSHSDSGFVRAVAIGFTLVGLCYSRDIGWFVYDAIGEVLEQVFMFGVFAFIICLGIIIFVLPVLAILKWFISL